MITVAAIFAAIAVGILLGVATLYWKVARSDGEWELSW